MGQCAQACCTQKDELTSYKISNRSIQLKKDKLIPDECKLPPDHESDAIKNSMSSKVSLQKQFLSSLTALPIEVQETLNKKERTKLPFSNGITYEGEWRNGQRDGLGIQIWPDGSKYEGQWKHDKANGKGKLIHKDGDIYEGDWVDDSATGKGKYIHQNGAVYEGDWIKDNQHGYGVEKFPNGTKYEGEYYNGQKQGNGQLIFNDGAIYQGQFTNNEIGGFGIYKWPDGRKYEGNWVENKMNGDGYLIWPDGKSYKGVIFQKNKRNLNKIQSMALEYLNLRRVENLLVNGRWENNMELEYIIIKMKNKQGCGIKEKKQNGLLMMKFQVRKMNSKQNIYLNLNQLIIVTNNNKMNYDPMASNTSLGQETKKLNQNQLQVPNVPNPMDGSNPSFKQLNSSMVSGQKITCPHFTSNTLPKISCFEHPDQYLTNFCKSEKCLFPLCPQCVTQHVTEHFEDKSQPKLDSLENVLNQICSVIFDQANQLQQCFCSIQNSVCQAKVQDDSLIKKLNDIRQRIIKIVDQHFNALENELKNKQSKNFSNYNRDADSFVKLLQDRFDSHISFLERMKQTDCMRIVIPFYRSTVLQDNKLYFAMAQDYAQKYQQFSSEITFDPMKSSQMGNYLNSFIQVVNYDLPEFLDIHKLAASDITTSTKKVTSSQASSRVQSKQSISSGKKVQFEQNQPPSFHNSVAGSQRFNQSLQNIGSRKT